MDDKRPGALYASGACRTRDWKRRHEQGAGDASVTSRNGRPRRVELRVSLRKATRLAEAKCAPETAAAVRQVLELALTDRQRERLISADAIRQA